MSDSISGAGALVAVTKKKQIHKNTVPLLQDLHSTGTHQIQENVTILHTGEGLSCFLRQHKKVTA